jgi:hypothetical protein
LDVGAQVGDAADVVVVPVGEEGGIYRGFFRGEEGGKGEAPGGAAFACVEEDAGWAGAEEVCV